MFAVAAGRGGRVEGRCFSGGQGAKKKAKQSFAGPWRSQPEIGNEGGDHYVNFLEVLKTARRHPFQ